MSKTYFQKRIHDELNITEKQNNIRLKNEEGHNFETKIFTEDKKGNIQILLYTLNRQIIEYDHPKATLEKPNIYNDRIQTYQITRLHPDKVKNGRKYHIPKGAGTFPFFPFPVIEKFERKEKIKTLVITEGAFKAFKGAMHGLDIVGLSSITHYRNKNTKELHKDIIRLIKVCDVKNIIMLYDGDCLDVSENAIKEEKDLYKRPNKLNDLETVISPRLKSTITDDHGKNFLEYLAKFKDFVNVPDHTNYQRVIHNCYNSYAPFSHVPEKGNFNKTIQFLEHIFEEQTELGLDYIQLLYQQPTQKLPILCLVSKENATGKSTFAKWLQRFFSQNVTIIGNAEISNDFNAHLSSKLVIAIDESFIEKKTIIEKIKNLATADSMPMNRKGKDIIEIDFFGKIILLSNNVDNFISATDEDIRYWVREIKRPQKEETNLLDDMQNEIPAFLDYLEKRKMHTERKSRAWFNPAIIKTEALQKVIEASKPKIVRELESNLKEMFMQFHMEEIYMSVKDIKEMFFEKSYRTDNDYIIRTLKKEFSKVKQYKNKEEKITTKRYKIPFWQQTINPDGNEVFEIAFKPAIGHPYVFKAKDFLTKDELETFKNSQPEPEDLPF